MRKEMCASKEEKTENTANDIIDKKGPSGLVVWLFWLFKVRQKKNKVSDKGGEYHESVLPPEPVPHWSTQSVKHYNPRQEQLVSPCLLFLSLKTTPVQQQQLISRLSHAFW
ncbi:hypothetical protein CRENBAI_010309 [Crenichthys baileyi]|uniref:Uncharacterized protein n=1 Tax=Crenichthys baileyi TaxID=28760 RepID=A0AAV9R6X4_9TELE